MTTNHASGSTVWIGDYLDEISARKGCTDLTLFSDGRLSVRIMRQWQTVEVPAIRNRWQEIVEMTARCPEETNTDPRGYTTTVATKTRRYRVNFARYDQGEVLSMRPLPNTVPSPDSLRIPQQLVEYACGVSGGLILVGGRTGMGKSTTVASLMERRSKLVGGKYVTIERPIEYRFQNTPSGYFMQREIGHHVSSYEKGIVEAMHQNPDGIIIQEILDRASADAALAAALTGHLVVATLHAYTASTLPQRMLAILGGDAETQSNWSDAMASCLQAAVVQELVPGPDGLVHIFDMLFCCDPQDYTPINPIQRALRLANWQLLRQELQGGITRYGFLSFEKSRAQRVSEGLLLNT